MEKTNEKKDLLAQSLLSKMEELLASEESLRTIDEVRELLRVVEDAYDIQDN